MGEEKACLRCSSVKYYNVLAVAALSAPPGRHQFSATSGTVFSSRKTTFTDLLTGLCLFANAINHKKIANSGEGYWNKADAQHGIDLAKGTRDARLRKVNRRWVTVGNRPAIVPGFCSGPCCICARSCSLA
jgi:uncharacterized protein YegP (UPF0339 family)